MARPAKNSIVRRFRLSILATAAIAVCVSGAFVIVAEYFVARDSFVDNVSGLSDVIGFNLRASLAFDMPSDAHTILASLATVPSVRRGVAFRVDGTPLAMYASSDANDTSFSAEVHQLHADSQFEPAIRLAGRGLIRIAPIVSDGERIGSLAIEASLEEIYERLQFEAVSLLLIVLVAMLLASFAGNVMQQSITKPIQELAAGMRQVSGSRRYVQLERRSDDEIGGLVEGFNAMSAEIEARDQLLADANDELEQQVRDRTHELESTNRELSATIKAVGRERDRAEEANRAKSVFLATMSHEIRTPMNEMLGNTELLLNEPLGAHAREYGEIAYRSGEALLDLINDVLDFSRIEAGHLELAEGPFDLSRLIEQLAASLQPTIEGKGVALVLDLDAPPERLVLGDDGRLRQVLCNLISNAAKFTEEGSVRVSLRIVPLAGETLRARIEVQDSGIGIAPADQGRIFERFAQADGSWTRSFGGTGLGLAICKELIERMGGEIGVRSDGASGSTFWLSLVLSYSNELVDNDDADEPTFDGFDNETGCRVLVVDDTDINRDMARRMLDKFGCHVEVASDGQQAVECVAREQFDLILMDCQMPVMDGFRAARRIRIAESESSRPRCYIAALTANAIKGDRERCIKAGMDDYIPKPFKLADLRQVVQRVLNKGTQSDAQLVVRDLGAEQQVLDPAALAQIRALQSDPSERLLEQYVESFRESAPALLEQADDALSRGDAAVLAYAAHSLKGNCSSLGANNATATARALEELARRGDLSGALKALSQVRAELRHVEVALAEQLETVI